MSMQQRRRSEVKRREGSLSWGLDASLVIIQIEPTRSMLVFTVAKQRRFTCAGKPAWRQSAEFV